MSMTKETDRCDVNDEAKETDLGDVGDEGELEHPVQLDMLVLQHVPERAFAAVAPHQAHVSRLHAGANQLVHVRVLQSADLTLNTD